jgi:hypothetical protein
MVVSHPAAVFSQHISSVVQETIGMPRYQRIISMTAASHTQQPHRSMLLFGYPATQPIQHCVPGAKLSAKYVVREVSNPLVYVPLQDYLHRSGQTDALTLDCPLYNARNPSVPLTASLPYLECARYGDLLAVYVYAVSAVETGLLQ